MKPASHTLMTMPLFVSDISTHASGSQDLVGATLTCRSGHDCGVAGSPSGSLPAVSPAVSAEWQSDVARWSHVKCEHIKDERCSRTAARAGNVDTAGERSLTTCGLPSLRFPRTPAPGVAQGDHVSVAELLRLALFNKGDVRKSQPDVERGDQMASGACRPCASQVLRGP